MLDKQLSVHQWIALALLAVGVGDVQLQYQPPESKLNVEQNPLIGFVSVITMCFTSAFAGNRHKSLSLEQHFFAFIQHSQKPKTNEVYENLNALVFLKKAIRSFSEPM